MARPTPGPWVAQPGTTTGQEIVAPNAPKIRRVVARCGSADREANARLIATAPDMLAALKIISGISLWPEAQHMVDAAIAKAEGRS